MLKKLKEDLDENLFVYLIGVMIGILIIFFFSVRDYQSNRKLLENYIFVYTDSERDCKVVGDTNYKVSISRKYGLNHSIKGSIWELKNQKTKKTYTLTTDSDGFVCMIGLPKGDYSLKEVKVPKKRVKYKEKLTFSLNSKTSKKLVRVYDKDEKITAIALVIDELGIPINHAEFELYHGEEKILTTQTNENGQMGFTNIPRDEGYYLFDKSTNKKYDIKLEDTLNVYRFVIEESRF